MKPPAPQTTTSFILYLALSLLSRAVASCPPACARIENRLELSPMLATSKLSSAYRRARRPSSSRRPTSARRRRGAGDEAGLVARVDEDSATAAPDDLGREVVGRNCCEERTPRAEVAEDLRGNGERSGVRLEQGEQDVTACQDVRQDGVRLEGKQAKVEQALLLAPAAKPVRP